MAKSIVMVLSIGFVLIGLLGFISDPILGIFDVDLVHNIVHLLSGVVGLALGYKGEEPAKMFAKVFGLVYGLVAILGLLMGTDAKLLGLMEVNQADNWLHVLLAVVLLHAGFSKSSNNAGSVNVQI